MSNKTLELQIRIAADEAARIVSALKGDMKALAEEAGKYAQNDGAALNQSFKDAEAAGKGTVSSIGDIKKALGSLAEVAAATKALLLIKDMGAFALQTADNFQTARNQFGVLLGDMQAGAGLFNEIKAFNDVTPFDLDTLTQATNVLIAAKVPLQDLQSQLTKFGDLSQGNSQKMTSYVNAFSTAAAKGKADMQVLNTYLNQGVPILDALAKNFNTTTAEIVEMSSKGQISFADFSKALDDLTAAGGQYFGGMELASKSLAAMKEGLTEATNSLAASFGEMLMPAAIATVEILTNITNAINESPILKGVFAGALVTVAGLLAAKAVKATIAFAAQMKLNFAVGALNPVVLASTVAVAGIAAAYTVMATDAQKAARATENLALVQKKQNDATKEGHTAVQAYYRASQNFDIQATLNEIKKLQAAVDEQKQRGVVRSDEMLNLRTAIERFRTLRDEFIKEFYDTTNNEQIAELESKINIAQTYLFNVDISPEDKNKIESIIQNFQDEIDELGGSIAKKAAKWKEDWTEIWNASQAEQAHDPLYAIELEHRKKLKDAWDHYVREGDKTVIDQINAYYASQRSDVIKQLGDEEKRMRRELSSSKVAGLRYEYDNAIKAIDKLEAQRIIAAAHSEEEIAAIRKRFDDLRDDTTLKFNIEIKKTALDEAREAVKDWQQELSNSLTITLMNIQGFSAQAAITIGDLNAQLVALSASATLSGFEEFGRALGEGEDAAEAMGRALAAMSQQILRQLPILFLQAGLQLIANGQWPLGLGFIAAAGSSAIISGYVDGKSNAATANAHGNVYDEYGQAARAFAAGGAFTNQIVSQPTYFRYGGGFERGLMGEAGPEAIMPLTRMPNGDLGVQTAGSGSSVIINIINNSGAEVRQEETEGADGGRQVDIIIGNVVNQHIASGKADHIMGGRYGLRAKGV
ncbi:MAG: tape measure protein [Treponema sp.]|nr:tape measure protein [Treponema sp.]